MDEALRLKAKRRGLKGSVTKLLTKVEEVLSADLATVNLSSTSDSRRLLTSTTLTQLTAKKNQISELDETIVATIQQEEELETEVCDADTYLNTLEEHIAFLVEFVKRANQPPPSAPRELTEEAQSREPHELISAAVDTPTHEPEVVVEKPTVTTQERHQLAHMDSAHSYSRLPKLTLPTFSGNSLEWQTFWDSFSAAVDCNPHLSGVQKLNYLRSQLHGDAAHVIAGFPLTDANYIHSVELLKEKYGQDYKLVKAHMDAFLDIPAPYHNLASLQSFYNTININVRALSSLGQPPESYGPLLSSVILDRLAPETQSNMARDHYNSKWTVDELLAGILKEIRIFEASQRSSRRLNTRTSSLPTTSSFHTSAHTNRGTSHEKSKRSLSCIFCKGAHKPGLCTKVTSHNERLAIVRGANLCFNCLAHHKVSQCNSKFTCKDCHKKHHTSLCQAFTTTDRQPSNSQKDLTTTTPTGASPISQPTQTANTATTTEQSPTAANTMSLSATHTSVCLLKTAIANVSSGPITVEGHILFDEGAQRSFITQDLADELHLQPSGHENISVSSFGAQVSAVKSLAVAPILVHTLNGTKILVTVLIVPKLAAPVRNSVRTHLNQLSYLQHLPLAHPVTNDENFDITILIGADFYWRFVQDNVVRGDGPTAVESRLGYLLSGPLPLSQSVSTSCVHISSLSCIIEDTDYSTFWKMESMGTDATTQKNADEEFLTDYLTTKVTKQMNGSYALKFPWKSNHPPLPSNYAICARRTRSMAYRLAKTPKLLKMYNTIIEDQERRGFIEKVPNNFEHTETAIIHYIPHHPVRKESSTTPIRIVYDCSCKQSSESPSLNDCLEPGPPFLTDLCAILLRFRQHEFAFSSDIEKAFLHVHLDQSDRDATRFLWLSDPVDASSPFVTYRFRVVLFGATCSPFMLNAAITYHLSQNDSAVAHDILHNLYVDNLVSGCQTEQGALNYFRQSRTLLSIANFNLRSWTSNSRHLMNAANEKNVMESDNPVKVLGLVWNAKMDLILPSPKPGSVDFTSAKTKRSILKCASSIFDPLGLITPVTISAKLFIQQLWQQRHEWDSTLDEQLCTDWNAIACDILKATMLSYPRRCIATLHNTNAVLHVFADASPRAYGAAAYFQFGTEARLVMSKARTAPVKQHSLPRLELMAAVTAARLSSYITSSLDTSFTVCLWSDSQIVLAWLNSRKTLKPFVSHRVNEIRSNPATWRYCPSADNPADLLTRGITYDTLNSSEQWKHGPKWLSSPSQWPTWQQSDILHIQTTGEELEVVQDTTILVTTSVGTVNFIDISRFNTLSKLLSVTAYVLRFTYNCRHPRTRTVGPLSAMELKAANLKWLYSVQHTVFSTEIQHLQQSDSTRPQLVRQLRLFLDNNKLLRCGGRIHNAPLSDLAKFPHLLPSRHPLTVLIIKNAHLVQLHSGVNSTLTALRQNYWIPAGRQRIKSIIRKCVVCRRTTGKPYTIPDPPPLVKSRVSPTDPFAVTGVDFTGALYVRTQEGESKVYICLFTCAVSRAMHLEIVSNLTVECFLLAFCRFAARRSVPKFLISDNGSTYLAAAEGLERLFLSADLSEALAHKGTQWQFIPKRAPWFGGFWERLIGLTKSTLRKILGRTHATMESLQTIIVEVEGLLNDRPLTHSSPDIGDPEPITPAHLLHGRRITTLPHVITEDDEIADPNFGDTSQIRYRARVHAVIIKQFWNRWRHEYLTALRETHKTTGNNKQHVNVGDIVLVHDDSARVNWKLAIIESVNKGKDGLIRSANIRTANGRTNRPIARLYPLEVTATEETARPPRVETSETSSEDCPVPSDRPVREAAKRGKERMKEWVTSLCAPPEDVTDSD